MVELYGISRAELPTLEEALALCRFSDMWREHHRMGSADAAASLGGLLLLEAAGCASELAYTALGRPYLQGASVDFNYTHTETHVFLALARSQSSNEMPRVGIDAEDLARASGLDRERMAKRWMTAEERDVYDKSGNTDEAFLGIWTKKEAFVKWQGDGLRALRTANICTAPECFDVRFFEYRVGDSVIAVCTNKACEQVEPMRMLDGETLLKKRSQNRNERKFST